jgi:hypothetical protein
LRTRQRDEFLGEGRRVDGGPGGGLRAHGRRHLPRALKRAPGAAAGRRLAHFGSKRTSLVQRFEQAAAAARARMCKKAHPKLDAAAGLM